MRRRALSTLRVTDLMHAATKARLTAIADDVTSDEGARLESGLPVAAPTARSAATHWDFDAPSYVIDSFISTAFPECPHDSLIRIHKAVVARLALEHFAPEDELAPSVIDRYPAFFERLAQFLSHSPDRGYRFGFFVKDVRYALGLTVPCGLVQLDLRYRIGPKLVLRDIRRSGSARVGWNYVAASAWGRWYNTHIDSRDMSEFSPTGWTQSFSRIADMLEINRAVCGAAGVSWYYDPKVGDISPNLAYLRRNQVENGAFSLRLGPGAQHTANALYASRPRQTLYEAGKYLPAGFLIAWPRSRLIAWTRSADRAAEIERAALPSGATLAHYAPD